jgi:hypothetical protein
MEFSKFVWNSNINININLNHFWRGWKFWATQKKSKENRKLIAVDILENENGSNLEGYSAMNFD